MKRKYPSLPAMVICLIGAAILFFSIQTWGIRLGKVKGISMEPTFRDGDVFYVKAYVLLFRNPHKGEIVVLKDNDGYIVVKRVCLVPGEFDKISSKAPCVLGKDEYVVLGDNLNNSSDSRIYGPIKKNQLMGIVIQ